MSKAIFSGSNFKTLINDLTKVPSLGAFLDSELMNLEVKDGSCYGSSFGVLLSTSTAEAKGILPLVRIDERVLSSFSTLSAAAKSVVIEIVDNNIVIRNSQGPKVITPFQAGKQRSVTLTDPTYLEMDGELAKKIEYLSKIAFSDAVMPHLNCVYLTPKLASAVNQRCLALIKMETGVNHATALPIPLAELVAADTKFSITPETTVLHSGRATYSMPSPAVAQKSFPIKSIVDYYKATKINVATVTGKAFAKLVSNCQACLNALSSISIVLSFSVSTDGTLTLRSENSGTKFEDTIKVDSTETEAELHIPLEEIAKALAFLEEQEHVTLKQGPKGETYLILPNGMLMFPDYSVPKKKKK